MADMTPEASVLTATPPGVVPHGSAPLWWGTAKQDQVWGACNNISEKPSRTKEEYQDGNGDYIGVVYSGPKTEYTLEYTPLVVESGTDLPTTKADLIGSIISLPNIEGTAMLCLVDDAEKKRERGTKATFSLTVSYYPKITLTTT